MGANPILALNLTDSCRGGETGNAQHLKCCGCNCPCGCKSRPRHMNKKSKIKINQDFFKTWSSDMAYVLGFVVADGCIIKRKDRMNSYVFNITSKDKSILLKIREVLDSDHPIGIKFNSQKISYNQIQICDREICRDLMNLGICPRKTYNLGPIKVPDKYFSDFVRGFFDGDGTVYIYNVNGTPQIKVGFVSASLTFLTELNKQLCKNLRIPLKSIHKTIDQKRKTMVQFSICFYIDDCEKLYKFMYENASIFLDRKYRIFKKWESMKSKNRRHYIKQNYPSKIGWQLNQKVLA